MIVSLRGVEEAWQLTSHRAKSAMKISKALIRQIRCDLLSHTTDAEKAAAKICTQLGYKVIPQQPIVTGRKLYFADIYIPALKLIIEVNGGYHFTDNQRRKDKNRSQGVRRLGYSLFNITNKNARDIKKIEQLINKAKNGKVINKKRFSPKSPRGAWR